jgi:hypothetical protein
VREEEAMGSERSRQKERMRSDAWLFALAVFCMVPYFTILVLIELKWADGIFPLLLLGSTLFTLFVGLAVFHWWPNDPESERDEDQPSARDDR